MFERIEVVDLLLRHKLINQEQIDKAKEESRRIGLPIERCFVKLGFVTDEDITNEQASALGVPYINLMDYIIDGEVVKLIPENIAKKHKAIPLFKIGESLTVAMANPRDIAALDQIRRLTKIENIDTVLASEKGVQSALDSYYGFTGSVDDIISYIDREKIFETSDDKKLSDIVEETPVIKLVNIIVLQAVKDRASDIHIEPEENKLRVRYRIDGVLHEKNTFPKKLQNVVISRIKVLSKMDIAESRKPQDGRIRLRMDNKDLDIRVSAFPTIHGENLVLRLLDKSTVLYGLMELGFSKEEIEVFNKLIHRPNGIMLVTGPTGSGKTTTLYAALSTVNSTEKNIITLEDPVEYEIPLIRQTAINPKAGVTFATGLRSILRQDPDIIMVGEIRDKETAEISIQAALTGHLVFSTLHTNDAPSALTRLIDMGIEPFLISSSVIGILAQRLVRTICDKCKEKYIPSGPILKELEIKEGEEFFRGKGCKHCHDSGFVGRIGIYELIVMNEDIRKMVDAKKSADEIKRRAVEFGMKTLRQDGLEKAGRGVTTIEEVLRVTTEME
ncbi:MAG: type II secretion system ATPase GspE [Candidatus Omnitrophica bacterium]|nr:type II secretion system ATPase GspE [Candidatus Omnitrophota bacterium]MBU1869905.1 type II secretion system ATPase GspE [Candidatus Omnitrophota bacterium]